MGDIILQPITKGGSVAPDDAVGTLVLKWSAETALSAFSVTARKILLISIAVTVAMLGAAVLILRVLIIRPLNAAQMAIGRISDGELDLVVPAMTRADEIGKIARSIDELRKTLAKNAVAQREAAYKGAAFNSASAALMMTDQDFNICHVNPAMISLLTRFRDQVPALAAGVTAARLMTMSTDDLHADLRYARARLRHLDDKTFSIPIAFGDDRVALAISAVTDSQGEHIGLIMEWADVTQQWLNDAILHGLEEQQLRVDLDVDGRVVYINPNMCKALHRDAGALRGLDLNALMGPTPPDAPRAADILLSARENRLFAGQITMTGSDGTQLVLDGSVNAVRDSSGSPIRFILLARDITQSELAIRNAALARETFENEQSVVVEALRIGLRSLSDGDLTAMIDAPFAGAYEDLRTAYNGAVRTLAEAMRGVVENADNISNEARDISSTTDGLSRRTEATAATLEQTAAALNDLTSSIRATAQGAKEADGVVREARKSAEHSGQVVLETVSAMDQIAESSGRITSIIKVIDDIAFQTNLLALNAGVEAARAGDAGRGFAVVASEVRALAQRSSDAAREINDLIDKSGSQVRRGVDLVGRTGSALQQIVDAVSQISDLVSSIADSSALQSTNLGDINSSLNQLDQSTQQNAARLEETTAASESLRKDAVSLVETVAYFKVDETGPQGSQDPSIVSFRARSRQPARAPEKVAPSLVPTHKRQSVAVGEWEDF
ncbi:MAG: PAS domain-containing protein [Alphaproteobacteria bacterium]|nr:PAS domain-containing protein [Alphaproteobacteria bacterium]